MTESFGAFSGFIRPIFVVFVTHQPMLDLSQSHPLMNVMSTMHFLANKTDRQAVMVWSNITRRFANAALRLARRPALNTRPVPSICSTCLAGSVIDSDGLYYFSPHLTCWKRAVACSGH
jgi:hypothetical protein